MIFAQTDFILEAGPVLPVLSLQDDDRLLPMAEAIVAGGIKVFEVVLRTPTALEALKRLKGQVPILGVGTVLSPAQMAAAKDAGARFCVSPGWTPALHKSAQALHMPWLPGVATASEVMRGLDKGFKNLKFFPAERAGGPKALADFAAVFPGIRFCPTGGISAGNAGAYLANANVPCIGGSLATPKGLVAAQDWPGLEGHVRELVKSLTFAS